MIRVLLLVLLAGEVLSACDAPTKADIARDYPDAQSADFQVFARHCSQCHAPPRPFAHRRKEWPNVIARMQGHLVERNMAPIPEADLARIKRYLQTHAREGDS